jgi:hypothetical protein
MVNGTRSEVLAPNEVVAVSSSLTLPLTLGRPSVPKLNVDCHFPGPIDERATCGVTLEGPSERPETLVEVMTDIVTG